MRMYVGAARTAPPSPTIEVGPSAIHVSQKGLIRFEFGEALLRDPAQDQPGIMPRIFPQVAVQAAKQFDGGVIPRPAEIQR